MTEAVADTLEQQMEKAVTIVSGVSLEPEVTSIGVTGGADHDGEPALWVSIYVSRDFDPDKEQVKRLSYFARSVQAKLIDGGITIFPYTQLRQTA